MNRAHAEKTAVLCAGGTGGHLFPAQSVLQGLRKQGWRVVLISDARGKAYLPPALSSDLRCVASAAWVDARGSIHRFFALVKMLSVITWGGVQSLRLLRQLRPHIVVGFGGYPSVPPLLAAQILGLPTLLHEQNAVLGRANRLLAVRAHAVVMGVGGAATDVPPSRGRYPIHWLGTPLRPIFQELSGASYLPPEVGGVFKILVFGGSQGAGFFAQAIPKALALLPPSLRERVRLVQQCRAEDLEVVRETYAELGISAELACFFTDMPERICAAHLVLCRAGASSVAELSALGRPAILVPLPGSLSGDQKANADVVEKAGAGWSLPQETASPEVIYSLLRALWDTPNRLQTAATRARSLGRLDATERFCALIEQVATAKEDF